MNTLLAILLIVVAIFLILLVLVQRGRGGGLAGALGGMGGQSAFGTKAGDLFTRITIGIAAAWIILCVISVKVMGNRSGQLSSDLGGSLPQGPGLNAPINSEPSGKTGDSGAAPGAAAPAGGAAAPTGEGSAAPATAPSGGESKSGGTESK